MPKKYDLAVIVSTFQPFTLVDDAAFMAAQSLADTLLVIQADVDAAPGAGHPFEGDDVYNMISTAAKHVGIPYLFCTVPDYVYSRERWVQEVQFEVTAFLEGVKDPKVVMINFKDQKAFPQWAHHSTERPGMSKPQLLDLLFQNIDDFLPEVPAYLHRLYYEFASTPRYEDLQEEHEYFKTYDPKAFDVSMLTTDALVTCAGHLLLVERKFRPGKGLLALPGGFLKKRDWPEVGVIRELKQETHIPVKSHLLKSCMGPIQVFGDPNRSLRGRVLTLAAHVDLDKLSLPTLPKVKGADDAKKALWVPFGELPNVMFEDHRQIINKMLNL